MSTALTPLSEVERMLAQIETVDDAVRVRQAAAAAKEIAKRAGLSLEEQNRAAEAKIRAEWQGGRLLAALERGDPGGNIVPGKKGIQPVSNDGHELSPYATTLSEAGITRQDAARWQRIGAFPPDRLGELIAECRERGHEVTTAYLLRAWRREQKNPEPEPESLTLTVGELDELIDAGSTFGTIYADPPWQYGNQATRGATGDHYPGMTPDEVAALPIAPLGADMAHLHLWTTNAFLFDARDVMEAWGFEYKSVFVWIKPQMGMGNYWRVSHEFCLLGTRGSATFDVNDEMSWREWPRGQHSAKPWQMYGLIERVSPGPYLELFARHQRDGWTSWGNDVERDLFFREAG